MQAFRGPGGCLLRQNPWKAALDRRSGPGGRRGRKQISVAQNVHRVALEAAPNSPVGTSIRLQINRLGDGTPLVCWVHLHLLPAGPGRRSGCRLTDLFNNTAVPAAVPALAPAAPKKRGWLPLLTVLFCISYGLMTMLIVEQGRTIESQRALIRELFRDSTELSAVRLKAAQESAQTSSAQTSSAQTQARVGQHPSSQIPSTQGPSKQHPSTQYPSTQAQTSQAPSSQAGSQPAGPQHRAQSQSAKQKPEFRMPSKPAADLVDDVRTLITI